MCYLFPKAHVWRSVNNKESVSFYFVGPRDRTRTVRPDNENATH